MKRRYIAFLLIFIPTLIFVIGHYFWGWEYDFLFAYAIVLVLAFKGALLSFYSASKLKLIAFIKGLTLLQIIVLLIKRWFLDNVFAKWLRKNIIEHIIEPIKNFIHYYKSISLLKKIKSIFLPLILGIGGAYLVYYTGYLDKILLFTELKVIIIGFSKTLLAIILKVANFVFNSWLTPILEVFALSFLFKKLEEYLGKKHPIVRFFNYLGYKINRFFAYFIYLNRKYLDPLFNKKVEKTSKTLSQKLNDYINQKKIDYEYEQFEDLERKIINGHIDAYFFTPGLEKIKDKKKLYSLINKYTKDNLNIVAFVSRNEYGKLLDESVEDSYYHDIFILEGLATSHKSGVQKVDKEKPDYTDFWVLNTSNFPVTLLGTKKFEQKEIPPNSVVFVKTKEPIDYSKDKICFAFKDTKECAVVLEE